MRFLCRILTPLLFSAAAAGCATSGGVATPEQIGARIEKQTGQKVRATPGPLEIPSGVVTADGLTQEEAVAIALWNNPDFRAGLADLGIARADVAQAGLLRNPVLSLLLPWGPKQLEWTARWPIEAIWQRPKRLKAAQTAAAAVAERLVVAGLALVADVRLAHADLAAAEARVTLTSETAGLLHRISDIVRKRFEAGDISQLDADSAAVDARRADEDAARAALDVTLAADRLHQLVAVGDRLPPSAIRAGDSVPIVPSACADLSTLEKEALAARPELRAAEIEIEAAAARLGWEETRIFTLVAVLDANAEGKAGFEMGPGLDSELGLFDRNQAGTMRAGAELARGQARYVAARNQVLRELRDAHAKLGQSERAFAAWRDDIRPKLERQIGQTQRAYEAGELPLLAVLDMSRRLNESRARELDASAGLRRAIVLLERSAGRGCAPPPGDEDDEEPGLRTKNQEQRLRNQEPAPKNQPRTQNDEPRTKNPDRMNE